MCSGLLQLRDEMQAAEGWSKGLAGNLLRRWRRRGRHDGASTCPPWWLPRRRWRDESKRDEQHRMVKRQQGVRFTEDSERVGVVSRTVWAHHQQRKVKNGALR
jgi:hypothetical protein